MRILVVSDTHGRPDLLLAALRRAGNTDMLLHLGDGARDCYALEGEYAGEVWQVKGNCDFSPMDANERFLPLPGASVWMTHGHLYDAKSTLNRLWFKGRELGATVVCFGHTHVPLLDRQGEITMLNPGSLKYGRTYGLIEIAGRKTDISICNLANE